MSVYEEIKHLRKSSRKQKRKMNYCEQKAFAQRKIVEIYHVANGAHGYRMTCNLFADFTYLYLADGTTHYFV